MARLYYNRGGTASGTPVAISGAVLEISGDVVQISGQAVQISGQAVFAYLSGGSITASVSGQPVFVSGQAVFAYISGGSITASVSGQVIYVGESYVIQRDLGSSDSVIVTTMYVAPQPLIVDTINLNISSLPATVLSGALIVEISTSSAIFPFVRDGLDYRTYSNPTAKSVCYYPEPPLCVTSGDIVTVKYINDTVECAEARLETIMRSVK